MSAGLALQQQEMLQALWQPRSGASTRGMAAYKSNAAALAERALAAAYPVVAQLLGGNLAPLARMLWQRDPPQHGDIACWGQGLAALAESLDDLASAEPYLADVARTEWQLHLAATAADAQPLPQSFALLMETDPGQLLLDLGPATQVLRSRWPVVSVIQAHQPDGSGLRELPALLQSGAPQDAVIWRDGLAPRLRLAVPGEHDFITAVQAGLPLAAALDTARELDFAAWLAPAVHSRLLLAVRTFHQEKEQMP